MRDFNRGRSNRGRGDREMFDAVCDECGADCKVPFKPTGNKPIYCSHCFEKQGSSDSRNNRKRDRGRDRSFSRGSRDREMYSAVCDECGNKCEIPFKPSSDKPIYCSDCFAKKNEGKSRGVRGNRGEDFGKQLQAITEKLDEILQVLSLTKSKKVTKKKVTSKKVVKKIVAKSKIKPKKKPKNKVVSKKKVVKKKTVAKKVAKKKVVKKKK